MLQSRSHVDRVAGRQPLLRADHNFSGVHAGADAHGGAEVGRKLLVEASDGLAQPRGGAYRPQRIILMGCRDSEDRHHRVPDEFLHQAAMMLDHPPGSAEIPPHDLPEALWIQPFSQCR